MCTSVTYACCLGTFRYLTLWLLHTTPGKDLCTMAALPSFVTRRFSPVTRCLQYLRAFKVSPSSDRYFAVHMFAGHTCARSFITSRHAAVSLKHKSALAAGSWIWWHSMKLRRFPFILSTTGDGRLSTDEKKKTKQQFWSCNKCCLDAHCSRKIRDRSRVPDDLCFVQNLRICNGISRMAMT